MPPSNENQKEYTQKVIEFFEARDILYSIGEASKHLNGEEFNIGNFYHICDWGAQTAIMGGFEFQYVKAPMAGLPVIGRRIREVCEDFEVNGMKIKNSLYDSSILRDGKNYHKRLKNLDKLLGDKKAFKESIKKLDLEMRLNYANKHLKHNASVVRNTYGHDAVARDLIKMLKLPGYEKLKKNVELITK